MTSSGIAPIGGFLPGDGKACDDPSGAVVHPIDGGRSRIAEELPAALSIEVDAEGLVPVLRTLEAYGLVELDGNTWNAGPALGPNE